VAVGRRHREHDDASAPQGDESRPLVQAIAEEKPHEAGRDDEPEHKPMKMRIISEGYSGDGQYSDDDRHRQAMNDTDRR
jgi:hypothetical protein